MRNIDDRDYTRRPGFLHIYTQEAERMYAPPPPRTPPNAKRAPDDTQDMAALLPILMLLMREGADKWLLLALLYIMR